VTRPRPSIASRIVLLMALTGRYRYRREPFLEPEDERVGSWRGRKLDPRERGPGQRPAPGPPRRACPDPPGKLYAMPPPTTLRMLPEPTCMSVDEDSRVVPAVCGCSVRHVTDVEAEKSANNMKVIDYYGQRADPHNLKVTGSNPVPATTFCSTDQSLKSRPLGRLFAFKISGQQ
jgi:hypothetical protein